MNSPRILILATKQHIEEILAVLPGIDCRSTDDVDEASDMLLSPHRNFDVVVIDLAVADWQGFIRWMTDGVKVEWVAISERDDLSLRIKAAQFGVSGFLRWPDEETELKKLIDSLVR